MLSDAVDVSQWYKNGLQASIGFGWDSAAKIHVWLRLWSFTCTRRDSSAPRLTHLTSSRITSQHALYGHLTNYCMYRRWRYYPALSTKAFCISAPSVRSSLLLAGVWSIDSPYSQQFWPGVCPQNLIPRLRENGLTDFDEILQVDQPRL